MKSIAIIGTGLAGVNSATALRRHGYDGKLFLIGDEDVVPYDRPPLSKDFLAGLKGIEDIVLQAPEEYHAQDIDLRLGSRIERIDARSGALSLRGGESLSVDAVVLATGGRNRILQVPGSDLPGVQYLRTHEDATRLRERLSLCNTLVVVGGGFIGAEVAATARTMGKRVVILEQESRMFNRVLPAALSGVMSRIHREHGVEVRTAQNVVEIAGPDYVRRVVLADGSHVEADLVVVGIGMTPSVELAAGAGIACNDGIVVDEFGCTSNPHIYAVGDVARFPDPRLGTAVRRESWQHAQNHAHAAARHLVGDGTPYAEVPWFWSHQYDLDMQLAGHWQLADEVVTRGELGSSAFSQVFLRDGAVVGAFGLNSGSDVRGAMKLIAAGVAVPIDALRDVDTDLRRLASPTRAR